MRALLADDTVASPAIAKYYEIFAQQAKWFNRLRVGQFTGTCNGHPITPQQFAPRRSASDSGKRFVFFACEHNILAVAASGAATYLSLAAMISFAKSKIGFMSPYSGLTTSKYLTPGCILLSGGMSSFGMSMRREFAGSSTSPSFCRAI